MPSHQIRVRQNYCEHRIFTDNKCDACGFSKPTIHQLIKSDMNRGMDQLDKVRFSISPEERERLLHGTWKEDDDDNTSW